MRSKVLLGKLSATMLIGKNLIEQDGQLTNKLPTARLWHQMSEVPWQLFQLSRLAHWILVYTPSALLSLGILLTQAHVSIGPPKHVKSSAETGYI